MTREEHGREWGWPVDLVLAGAVMAVAAAVRLPYLHRVPVVTDEAFEVLAALSMLGGNFIWFGPFDPTTGPLITWLLGLVFWAVGPNAYVARAVTALLGILTVGVACLLGRSLAARAGSPAITARQAGVVAALLLAFNPVHTIVNSHVAWSNSATPLFAALAFLALHEGVRRRNGWLLAAGGLSVGLALQTHISILVLIPGLGVWFVAQRGVGRWLRSPWPYAAAGAAVLGYGNMIVYNILSRGGALTNVQGHDYAWESNPTLLSYLQNMAALATNVGRTAGGLLPRIVDPLGTVLAVLIAAWLVAAVLYAARRGEWLPLLVILSTVLVMPYFNKRYEGLLSQRYTSFLLPLAYAAMGWLAAGAFVRARKALRPAARLAAAGGLAAALILAISPVRATFDYYRTEVAAGRDNRASLALAGYLKTSVPPGTAVFLCSNLKDKEEGGGYRFLRALSYYLSMEGVEHRVVDLAVVQAELPALSGGEAWLVITEADYRALSGQFDVQPVEGSPPVPGGGLIARARP